MTQKDIISKIGKTDETLRVGINGTIAKIREIKTGDYIRWIFTEDRKILLKKVPTGEENKKIPRINQVVKISTNHRISIPRVIEVAAKIREKDQIIWSLPDNNTDTINAEIKHDE